MGWFHLIRKGTFIKATAPPVVVSPDTELQFILSEYEATPKCSMTISHPCGGVTEHIAFKVKTTQPRRYLVRPNQGLIGPGGSETVQIILVEKDKANLLQSHQRLGQSGALDHSKDKFLVQICTVTEHFTKTFQGDQNRYGSLSTLWRGVTATASRTVVANKKLHVRHVVASDGLGAGSVRIAASGNLDRGGAVTTKHESILKAMESMSQEQLLAEVTGLRRKYDELVAFSVNLTAERDILKNTLEQTERDLNREVNARSRYGALKEA